MRRTITRSLHHALLTLNRFVETNHTLQGKPLSSPLYAPAAQVLLTSNVKDVYANLAAEEALLRGVVVDRDQGMLLFYINDPCVVIGRNQNSIQEVALRSAARDGVRVARRSSGGGAVFHDAGNLCLSFFTHRHDYAPEKTIQILRLALASICGVDAARLTSTKRHDLFIDGKKLTGSAMRVQRDIAVHHCTLLVNSCRESLGRYLHTEATLASFKSTSVNSVRSPVTTLACEGIAPVTKDMEGLLLLRDRIAEFYAAHGSTIMHHEAPWQLDGHAFSAPSQDTASVEPTLYTLDVRTAVEQGETMMYGDKRPAARGDASTMTEELARTTSVDWIYAMPRFTTEVLITRTDLTAEIDKQMAILKRELVDVTWTAEELAALLFPFLDAALVIETTVDHRRVEGVLVHARGRPSAAAAAAACEDVPITWVEKFLQTILTGANCDDVVEYTESDTVVRGFLMEGETDLVDVLRQAHSEASVESAAGVLVRALLACWRRMNVFDVRWNP